MENCPSKRSLGTGHPPLGKKIVPPKKPSPAHPPRTPAARDFVSGGAERPMGRAHHKTAPEEVNKRKRKSGENLLKERKLPLVPRHSHSRKKPFSTPNFPRFSKNNCSQPPGNRENSLPKQSVPALVPPSFPCQVTYPLQKKGKFCLPFRGNVSQKTQTPQPLSPPLPRSEKSVWQTTNLQVPPRPAAPKKKTQKGNPSPKKKHAPILAFPKCPPICIPPSPRFGSSKTVPQTPSPPADSEIKTKSTEKGIHQRPTVPPVPPS